MPLRSTTQWRHAIPWVLLGISTLALLILAVSHFREVAPRTQPLRFAVALPESTVVSDLSLSPDGRYLAISAVVAGKRSLWMRPLASQDAHPLPGAEDGRFPFWSPDGRLIGFFANGKLKKIALAGGPAQPICDAQSGRGGAWNRDGVIVFAPSSGSPLYRVNASGGVPTPVTSGPSDRYPIFLPDGNHFAYASMDGKKPGIYIGSLDSENPLYLLPDLSNLAYAPSAQHESGYLLFIRARTLMAQPIDTKRIRTDGDAIPVAEHVKRITDLQNFPFSAAANGILTWVDAGRF